MRDSRVVSRPIIEYRWHRPAFSPRPPKRSFRQGIDAVRQ